MLREDEERVRRASSTYGRDIRDPNLYDVTFSLDCPSLAAIFSAIAGAARRPELTPSVESTAAPKDLAPRAGGRSRYACRS